MARLDDIVEDFASAPQDLRLEMLLEYSDAVPTLPPELADQPLEQVTECQTPFFLTSRLATDGTVDIWFDCPPEAPTTRGFAGILSEGLSGHPAQEILDVPGDFYLRMGLGEVISPLRLRGMTAILNRLKRQVRERQAIATGGRQKSPPPPPKSPPPKSPPPNPPPKSPPPP